LSDLGLKVEDFVALEEGDRQLAKAVAAGRCPLCGGPLHQANYLRKPRGGGLAAVGEGLAKRYALCCGRRGCRRRQLPPSLRFLGRRVYLEVVVLFASALAQVASTLREASAATKVPRRTLQRWLRWWRAELPRLGWWAVLRARFAPPPPKEAHLPGSLLERLLNESGGGIAALVQLAARCLAPGTTRIADAARFLRDVTSPPDG
jgi:hypothetical protein